MHVCGVQKRYSMASPIVYFYIFALEISGLGSDDCHPRKEKGSQNCTF